MARVRVVRSKQLTDKLKRIADETREDVGVAVGISADMIVATMKAFVPVDEGDLKQSIGWTHGDAPRGSLSKSQKKGSTKVTIYAGSSKVFWAKWVEFGTAPHVNEGMFKGSDHPGTSPQPFFFPAYRANKKQAKKLINQAIRKAIKDIVTS